MAHLDVANSAGGVSLNGLLQSLLLWYRWSPVGWLQKEHSHGMTSSLFLVAFPPSEDRASCDEPEALPRPPFFPPATVKATGKVDLEVGGDIAGAVYVETISGVGPSSGSIGDSAGRLVDAAVEAGSEFDAGLVESEET